MGRDTGSAPCCCAASLREAVVSGADLSRQMLRVIRCGVQEESVVVYEDISCAIHSACDGSLILYFSLGTRQDVTHVLLYISGKRDNGGTSAPAVSLRMGATSVHSGIMKRCGI